MLFLGCDSGATKASFVIAHEGGAVLAHQVFPGVTLVSDGRNAYTEKMRSYLSALLQQAGAQAADITCAAFGLTGYGESKTAAADMQDALAGGLPGVPCLLRNDAVMGWSGALRCQAGICIASGTGSVAYGEDASQNGARAGGWSIRFGDEGSAYWIASQALRAFFHQADGRAQKTMLYDAFLRLFGVEEPLFICGAIEEWTRNGNFSRVAQLQRAVLTLCGQGDPCAREIYQRAALELAALVRALTARLSFPAGERVRVSYSGGVFHAGEWILAPLRAAVAQAGGALLPPAYGALAGAAGYAARAYLPEPALDRLMARVDQHILTNTTKKGE